MPVPDCTVDPASQYFPLCDICGKDPAGGPGGCDCPECPVCGVVGDPRCYTMGHFGRFGELRLAFRTAFLDWARASGLARLVNWLEARLRRQGGG